MTISDIGGEGAFKPRDMMQLMRNAFEGAWLPTAERGRYIAELDNFAAGLDAESSALMQ